MNDFEFDKKSILKHKKHVTINEGDEFDQEVSHLERRGDEYVELKRNEAAIKYGSRKLMRQLDFKSRDDLHVKESGLGKTPDWFEQVAVTINWDEHETFLYELSHLWVNMFFVRELYGEEQTGREQIIRLTDSGEENDLGLVTLCQLDYDTERSQEYERKEVDGFIEVSIPEREGIRVVCDTCNTDKVVETDEEARQQFESHDREECDVEAKAVMDDFEVDYKQAVFSEDEEAVADGLKELLVGICLKHDYDKERLEFKVEKLEGGEYHAFILNKDFTIRFNEKLELGTGISPWVIELLYADGCPLDPEAIEVKK